MRWKCFIIEVKKNTKTKSADEKLYIEIRGKFFKNTKKKNKNCGMIEERACWNILWEEQLKG